MIIEVKNGTYWYIKGKSVLNNISFSLEEGSVMTILGQNGVGKTTLLKCISGLLKWKSGETIVHGRKIMSINDFCEIGYVPQARGLAFPYTVKEMTSMGRARYVKMFSVPSKADIKKIEDTLEDIGIAHLADIPCNQLSGGQLQLVYIARALVAEPKVLILDEPESHLDFKNQLYVLKLIKHLVDEKGISCIINTHNPENALKISDKTLFLGKNDYLVGETKNIITEENIKKYFDVTSKIVSVPHEDEILTTIIAIK
ncbi:MULTISPECIES: ABC transporter ATP-binding protein [unclassified Clostridium]|uniref:ABC transporter ATP-binding protein n=1 Tax=unclassified Clostridium TaxID=2614128 RepID=UPI000EF0A9E4|nr:MULTISPECIES: ABC transporter ATP-binding protein [unclassified Clostridium]HCQ89525.1 ABC transporter ATP-binding protein [Clostridium sp.]